MVPGERGGGPDSGRDPHRHSRTHRRCPGLSSRATTRRTHRLPQRSGIYRPTRPPYLSTAEWQGIASRASTRPYLATCRSAAQPWPRKLSTPAGQASARRGRPDKHRISLNLPYGAQERAPSFPRPGAALLFGRPRGIRGQSAQAQSRPRKLIIVFRAGCPPCAITVRTGLPPGYGVPGLRHVAGTVGLDRFKIQGAASCVLPTAPFSLRPRHRSISSTPTGYRSAAVKLEASLVLAQVGVMNLMPAKFGMRAGAVCKNSTMLKR